jgi:tetratricopeptide (TPR) repeat protein
MNKQARLTHPADTIPALNKPFIHVLTIIFVVLLIYSNTFNAPFQFDDAPNIVDNPAIKDFQYFSDTSRAESIDVANNKALFKTRYIGYLTFALNYRLHGLDVTGYHLVNIFIHMFNSLLLYRLMTLTLRTPFFSAAGGHLALPDSSRSFIAFFTTLIFAVHPIQTQAVTYIVQRFASLATLFYLMSLVMYIKWKEKKEQQANRYASPAMFYTVSLVSAVLAMKTKEFAFTLPVVMTMYELMFFDGKTIKRLLYLVPFFLTILLIPLSLADTGSSLTDISGINDEAVNMSGASESISRPDYLFTQFRVIVTYVRLLFFPVNQNIDYDYPIYKSFFSPAVFLSFLFLLSLIIAGIYVYRLSKRSETKDRYWFRLISFGIFWFFIALFAESGIIPIRDVIFEHRVYLPSVGFFMILTVAIGAGLERWGSSTAHVKKAVLYVMLAVILVFSGATYARNTLWNDSVRLWGNAIEGSPNKARPHYNLGLSYKVRGRIDEAINEYQIALKLKPDFAETRYNLGMAYEAQGRLSEAINEYQTALKLNPAHARSHNNLGNIYAAQGRIDEAINEYKTVLNLSPNFIEAHNNLGVAYKAQGQIDEAINEYQIALKLKPDYAEVHNNLGIAYKAEGQIDEAINEYQTAVKLKPDYAYAHNNLGVVYVAQGRINEAINEYQIALKLKPDLASARQNLDLLLKN